MDAALVVLLAASIAYLFYAYFSEWKDCRANKKPGEPENGEGRSGSYSPSDPNEWFESFPP